MDVESVDAVSLISTLKVHKAVGPGSILTIIVKQFKKFLSKPLTNLINLSFSTGLFPKTFNQAKIILIFEKRRPTRLQQLQTYLTPLKY